MRTRAERASDYTDILHVYRFQVDLGNIARKRGYHYPTRAVCEVGKAFAHIRTADAVYRNVDGMTALRLGLKHLCDIGFSCVDNYVSTEMLYFLCLFVRADGCYNSDAVSLGKWNRNACKAASAGVHKKGVPLLDLALDAFFLG